MSKQEQGDNLSDDGDKEDDEEYPPWLQHIVEGEYYNAVRVVEEEGRLVLLQLLSVRLCCGSTGSGPNKHLSVSVCSFVLHHTVSATCGGFLTSAACTVDSVTSSAVSPLLGLQRTTVSRGM